MNKEKHWRFCVVISHGTIAPWIMSEWARVLEQLGHAVLRWDLRRYGQRTVEQGGASLVADVQFLDTLRQFKPQVVLSYGLAGLLPMPGDTSAASSLFHEMGAREALLLYDTPMSLGPRLHTLPNDDALICCWDASYVELLRSSGLKHVLHLPLATSLHTFSGEATANGTASFVGRIYQPERAFAGNAALEQIKNRYVSLHLQHPSTTYDQLLSMILSELPGTARPGFEAFLKGERATAFLMDCWRYADTAYRREAIRRLDTACPVCVFSNDKSMPLDGNRIILKQEVAYGQELASVYASSAINLNLTNSHLRTAVNQRVFDVPAAGGFLLTDWRAELEELFEIDREVVCFKSLDELVDKARYYRDREQERARITQRARARVLACHTWKHRAERLLQALNGAC